jgi:hypothetical protein
VVLRQLCQLQITQEFGQCAPAALQNYGQVSDRLASRQTSRQAYAGTVEYADYSRVRIMCDSSFAELWTGE